MIKNMLHDKHGERKDQLLTVVDKNGNILGTQTREKCHLGDGIPHLAFMMFLVNEKGKVILAKRSLKKTMWPGVWDTAVVSHVLPEETPFEAAKRRAGEEAGVEVSSVVKLGAFYYFKRQNGTCENEYCYVLLSRTDKEIKPNEVEIDKIKNVTIEKLEKDVKKHPEKYAPWFKIALTKYNLSTYIFK